MLHYSQMSSATHVYKIKHTHGLKREREIRKESVRDQSFAHARAHTNTQGTDANMLKEGTAYTTTIKESPNTDTHTDTQTKSFDLSKACFS